MSEVNARVKLDFIRVEDILSEEIRQWTERTAGMCLRENIMAPSNAKPIGGTYKWVADGGLLIIIGNVVGTRNDVCDVYEWSVGGRSENMVVIEDRVSLEICTMHVKLRIVFNIGGESNIVRF